jgi:hypothetical protein
VTPEELRAMVEARDPRTAEDWAAIRQANRDRLIAAAMAEKAEIEKRRAEARLRTDAHFARIRRAKRARGDMRRVTARRS